MCFARIFALVNLKEETIDAILKQVDRRWDRNESNPGHRMYYDTKAILLYIRGHCFQHVGRMNDAIVYLEQLIEFEKKVTYATHIPPQAAHEIGRLYHDHLGKQDIGIKWVKRSLTYSGYPNAHITEYRAKMTLQDMRREKKLAKSNSNKDKKNEQARSSLPLVPSPVASQVENQRLTSRILEEPDDDQPNVLRN